MADTKLRDLTVLELQETHRLLAGWLVCDCSDPALPVPLSGIPVDKDREVAEGRLSVLHSHFKVREVLVFVRKT